MICPICGEEINGNPQFCEKCGKKIPRCPSCGKVIARGVRYCINDGTIIPDEIQKLFDDAPKKEPVKITAKKRSVPPRFFCVKCGKPCAGGETLCKECKNKSTKIDKKKMILPIIISGILALLLLAGCVIGIVMIKAGTDGHGDEKEEVVFAMSEPETSSSVLREPETSSSVAEEPDSSPSIESEFPALSDEKPEISSSVLPETASDEEGDTEPEAGSVLYFILNCDKTYFTESDIKDFTANMCRLARNGIYARNGRKFDDESLTAYFEQYDWYNPTIAPDDFSDTMLNAYQKANRDLIVNFEKKQGYR